MLCMLLDVHLLDTHLRVFQRNIKAHSKQQKKYSQKCKFSTFGCIFEIWLDFEIHTDQLFGDSRSSKKKLLVGQKKNPEKGENFRLRGNPGPNAKFFQIKKFSCRN